MSTIIILILVGIIGLALINNRSQPNVRNRDPNETRNIFKNIKSHNDYIKATKPGLYKNGVNTMDK